MLGLYLAAHEDDASALQSVAAGCDEDVAVVLEHLIKYTQRFMRSSGVDERAKYQAHINRWEKTLERVRAEKE
eukprot:6716861-Pyramimonas_sp.AAC.1